MKKVYEKPSVVVDTFLASDCTSLTFQSNVISPNSGFMGFTKLNS